MFTTFTDWEFDGNVENATQNAKNFWPEMKAAGAVSMRATVTGPNSIRTMTLWSSKEVRSVNPRSYLSITVPYSSFPLILSV